MTKLARIPAFARSAEVPADATPIPRLRTRYYAFLSYSHADHEVADWLHRELERFRVPYSLSGRLTANGVVPRRLSPIFRDEQDLSAGGDLAAEIKAALAASQFLIVLCSPTAAKSRWTNEEIESFKRTRPEGCVLAAVVSGEPFASDVPGREAEECFPPALRHKYDRRGHRTAKRAEPLAADFRKQGEGKRLAFLKLVSGMLGVGLDELVRREQTRRHRQLAWVTAGSLAGMTVTSGLAVTAIHARDEARDQRRNAEGLIGFMLGDLKDKLTPIGKLDALDGVGAKVLAYYRNEPIRDLSDAALSQRSQALSLMADVATQRGSTDTALGLYREAMAGTAEAIRRQPNDPERLFEHAQNVFYVGEIAYQRGQLDQAGAQFGKYKELADRMVAIDPNNMKWRMEVQNSTANLAAVRLSQRRFDEAAILSQEALKTIEALATADPENPEYQQSRVESLSWAADALRDAGHVDQEMPIRERHLALLKQLLAQTGDVTYRQRLTVAERRLGFLYATQGHLDVAAQHARAATEEADQLTALEPNNTTWLENSASAKNTLAMILLLSGKPDEAADRNEQSCAIVSRLAAKDSTIARWRADLRDCWTTRSSIALAKGANAEAASDARHAIQAGKAVKTSDAGSDAFGMVRAYRLLGDAEKAAGNQAAATDAWNSAFRALPRVRAERPIEMHEHAILLQRLGRAAEAQQINRRLEQIGFRLPQTYTA